MDGSENYGDDGEPGMPGKWNKINSSAIHNCGSSGQQKQEESQNSPIHDEGFSENW